ncbi:hypothetical protein D6856_02455 [Butyrivibrio sp. XB500-5]|uniref:hypothetical protein n=1 Tax=Butyrivibrio sp. XB500-5 TaxID=2364880 RepID=UPI000EA9DB1B|nr:hypothetical protein [Butyrivibrio sp. XB500-5]RKM63004.1 hypothetical protein D6856_02455 [Butyrivibrio sp. XB500-5]
MLSRNEKRIDNLCISEGFEPKDVYDLTKILLEHYRNGFGTSELFRFNLDEEGIKRQKAQMRRDFLEAIKMPMEESKEYQDRLYQNLRDCPWMRQVLDTILDAIGASIEDGPLYKRIIENYYLQSGGRSNEDMARVEHLSTASIERKKREAIKFLGICLYRFAHRREMEDVEEISYVGTR